MAGKKKLWQNDIFNGFAIPVAIVLGGALIIFGVSRMLSSERTYQDLLVEMRSKTFGNKWVAAFELSKVVTRSQIPQEELPQFLIELEDIYKTTDDVRTQEFIVATAGQINHPLSDKILDEAMDSQSSNIQFHAVVAYGNRPPGKDTKIPFLKLFNFLKKDDEILQQAVILTLGIHRNSESKKILINFLSSSQKMLKYSAATSLIPEKENEALSVLEEILFLTAPKAYSKDDKAQGKLNINQVSQLKMNILKIYEKFPWQNLDPLILRLSKEDASEEIKIKAQDLLNQLKK